MVKKGLDCRARTGGVLIAPALLPNRIGLIDLDAPHIFQHLMPANTCANRGKALI